MARRGRQHVSRHLLEERQLPKAQVRAGALGGSTHRPAGQAAAGPPFPLGTVLPPTGLSDTGQQGGAEGRGATPDPKQLLTFTAYSLPALRPRYTFPKAPRLMGFTMVNSSIDGGRGTSMRLGPAAAGTASPRSCSSGRGSAAGSTAPMSHPAPPPRADSKRRPPRPAPPRGVTGQRPRAGAERGALARSCARQPLGPVVAAGGGALQSWSVSLRSRGPGSGQPALLRSRAALRRFIRSTPAAIGDAIAGLCVVAAAVVPALVSQPCGIW